MNSTVYLSDQRKSGSLYGNLIKKENEHGKSMVQLESLRNNAKTQVNNAQIDLKNDVKRSSLALIEENSRKYSPFKTYLYKYDLKNKVIDGKVKQVLDSYNCFNELNNKSNW